jgi:hypothetical protein
MNSDEESHKRIQFQTLSSKLTGMPFTIICVFQHSTSLQMTDKWEPLSTNKYNLHHNQEFNIGPNSTKLRRNWAAVWTVTITCMFTNFHLQWSWTAIIHMVMTGSYHDILLWIPSALRSGLRSVSYMYNLWHNAKFSHFTDSKSISGSAPYVTLQKYFSNPFFVIYFFASPPIKLKLGLQMGGRLLIANHPNQSLWLADQK